MYLSLYIDNDEALGELSDKELLAEIKRRNIKGKNGIDMSDQEKIFQLRSAGLELRKHNKLSYAVWLEDIAADME